MYERVHREWQASSQPPDGSRVYQFVRREWEKDTTRRRYRRWALPVALAASVVLAVTLVLQPPPSAQAPSARALARARGISRRRGIGFSESWWWSARVWDGQVSYSRRVIIPASAW